MAWPQIQHGWSYSRTHALTRAVHRSHGRPVRPLLRGAATGQRPRRLRVAAALLAIALRWGKKCPPFAMAAALLLLIPCLRSARYAGCLLLNTKPARPPLLLTTTGTPSQRLSRRVRFPLVTMALRRVGVLAAAAIARALLVSTPLRRSALKIRRVLRAP